MILLDTNVLVYAVNADSPQHRASQSVVDAALDGDLPGVLVPQVLLEFYAVVTNARRLARPLDPDQAWQEVTSLRATLPLLDPRAATLTNLSALVRAQQPRGGHVFDLFLVAQMRFHGVSTICTYNLAHFSQVRGIEALTPEDVLARYGPAGGQQA